MKDRKKPETLRLRSAMPGLTVNDLEQSVAWYRDVLGFVLKEEHRHDDQLVGASMQAGVVGFMLGQDDFAKGREREKGVGCRMYCETGQDIDELAANIKARGGVLLSEPVDQPWGYRDFAVEDPDGYKISIGRRIEEG